jgi:hypothetical protein
MRIRGTREDALNLPTYRCITISLNLDEESISVLPDMGASHWEKMLVLDCEQPSHKFARKDGNGWDEKVAAQLPALLYQPLYEYEIPEALQDKQGRYGVRYSNPKWEKELALRIRTRRISRQRKSSTKRCLMFPPRRDLPHVKIRNFRIFKGGSPLPPVTRPM